MGIVVVLMLPNPRLCFYLSDISGEKLKAELIHDILLHIIVGIYSADNGSKSGSRTEISCRRLLFPS